MLFPKCKDLASECQAQVLEGVFPICPTNLVAWMCFSPDAKTFSIDIIHLDRDWKRDHVSKYGTTK